MTITIDRYRWLANIFGLRREVAHIQNLTIPECERVIQLSLQKLAQLERRQNLVAYTAERTTPV